MIRFGYGQKTDAEIALVTHSAFFVWVTREDRIWKMLSLANSWEPAEVLVFIQAADPNYAELLSQIGIRAEDIPQA